MKTLICPACGCSLVRLGISRAEAVVHSHHGEALRFCCQGCVDLFITDPRKYLEETKDLIVCPTCLAEKPFQWATELNFDGHRLQFCRCPFCREVFKKNPEYYLNRLNGVTPYKGVLGHERCCVR